MTARRQETTLASKLNEGRSSMLVDDIKTRLDRYGVEIDVSEMSTKEAYQHIKSVAKERNGSYIVSGSSVRVYSHDDDTNLHVRDYIEIIGSPRYEQKISDADVGKYVRVMTIDEARAICPDLVREYNQDIYNRVTTIDQTAGPRTSCGVIFSRIICHDDEFGHHYVPSIFIKSIVTFEESVRLDAEKYYDEVQQVEKEEALRERRRIMTDLINVERKLFVKQDRESAVNAIIQRMMIGQREILERYDCVQSYTTQGNDVSITFKPGVQMRYYLNGNNYQYIDFVSLMPAKFTFNKNRREPFLKGPLRHPHISGGGDFCQGGFAADFSKATALKDIYYMIELLLVFMSSAGLSSTYFGATAADFSKYWMVSGYEPKMIATAFHKFCQESPSKGDQTKKFIEFCNTNKNLLKEGENIDSDYDAEDDDDEEDF